MKDKKNVMIKMKKLHYNKRKRRRMREHSSFLNQRKNHVGPMSTNDIGKLDELDEKQLLYWMLHS